MQRVNLLSLLGLMVIVFLMSCNKDTNTVTPVEPTPVSPTPTETEEEYSLLIENDVRIKMRDGVEIAANVYRPDAAGKFPVIIAFGPYGKDNIPVEYEPIDGDITVSPYAAFETPDPEYWIKHGYIVIIADTRGSGKSDGALNLLEEGEARDYYDLIEWAGVQDWSSGKVGLNGVSIFAINQWNVAALNPPHLAAIIVWEGFTDPYRDGFYHGGIPNVFIDLWFQYNILENLSPTNTGFRDIPAEVGANPLSTGPIYQDLNVLENLPKITVPAYIATSWQDHGLHTRGTIRGFEQINSEYKWLDVHGRKKWEYYYGEKGVNSQKQFFDHFLKETDDAILNQPRVRYEMRTAYYEGTIKTATDWPLSGRDMEKLYLDATQKTLSNTATTEVTNATYDATPLEDPELIEDSQRLVFKHTFSETTKIVGSMKLKLHVSTDQAEDIDLFVGIQKADANGNIIYFQGPEDEDGQVASGWQRVSKRALDTNLSTNEIPFHRHDVTENIQPNEIVEVEIEIWPTATQFSAGEQLLLVVQGNDIEESGETHKDNVNLGNTSIYTGGEYDSYLQIPTL